MLYQKITVFILLIFSLGISGPKSLKLESNCNISKILATQYEGLSKIEIEYSFSPLETGALEVFPEQKIFPKIEMQSTYIGETKPTRAALIYGNYNPKSLIYLTPESRQGFKLRFGDDGKLYTQEGKLFDTRNAKIIDIEGRETVSGRAIFVLSPDGGLYASTQLEVGMFQHSSFFAGGDVATAGEMKVHDGVIVYMNNKSGHYEPPIESIYEFENYLREVWKDKAPLFKIEKQIRGQ